MLTSATKCCADKEAEFEAAKEAIKLRYEKEAEAEDANVKALAEMQTKELEEVTQGLRTAQRPARQPCQAEPD